MVETTRHPRIPLSSDRGRCVRVGIGARTSRLCARDGRAGGATPAPSLYGAGEETQHAVVHRRRVSRQGESQAASRRRSEMRGGVTPRSPTARFQRRVHDARPGTTSVATRLMGRKSAARVLETVFTWGETPGINEHGSPSLFGPAGGSGRRPVGKRRAGPP